MALKLGFDLDDVVTNSCATILEMVNKHYNVSIDVSAITDTCLETCTYVEDPELNVEIKKTIIKWINDAEVQLTLPIYDDAKRYLRRFKKSGHQLYFVSARPKKNEVLTVKWLRKHGIPFDGVYIIGKAPKGELGRRLKLDFFIDDMSKNLKSMLDYKKQWKAGLLLMERPWNKNDVLDKKIKRVAEWYEVERHLGTTKREYNH